MNIVANLIVKEIEPCLEFWITRLGFEQTLEVPEGKKLGFVILKKGKAELMLQSVASVAKDVPPMAKDAYRSTLYITVNDLAPVRKALDGIPYVVPERRTFYGADEIIVRDPAGNLVFFSCHA
ncbi:VOC family protein [Pendulispora albinea]|uniref:Glyoxalase/fosfomycin resistance/dioxygenase domain-containing protein n=1 Tax=Pendulispora albinea TaxID=2741071 RepID=A0ABZ2LXI8_9BACT